MRSGDIGSLGAAAVAVALCLWVGIGGVGAQPPDQFGIPTRPQRCEHSAQPVDEGNGTSAAAVVGFEYVDSSMECAKALGADWSQWRLCSESELSVDLFTDTILPSDGNVLPLIRLNMSATAFDPVSAIWFVYNCLNAPDHDDLYCHGPASTQKERYGANVPPCRGVRVAANSTAAFRTDIICFRVYGLSQYRLDVVLMPQQCVATALLTMPFDKKYDPRIHRFFSERRNATLIFEHWSPFVFVETHPTDRPPLESRFAEVSFALYKQLSADIAPESTQTQFIREERIRLPELGFKWTNLEAGSYLVYAFVQRPHCRLSCDADVNCTLCAHTMLNFTIPADKATTAWLRSRALVQLVTVAAIVFFVILLIFAISLLAVVVYLRVIRPRRQMRRPAQNFELTARPRVLLVYSDDCAAHSEAVLELAHFLEHHASATVHIDQEDLRDPAERPTHWMAKQIEAADFVIVVFSEASMRVLRGETMKQRRPYPDLFQCAVNIVMSKISSLNRPVNSVGNGSARLTNGRPHTAVPTTIGPYVAVRFSYSPPSSIHEFFPHTGCRVFVVPDELNALIAHLHGAPTTNNTLLEFHADRSALDTAIANFGSFQNANADFLTERFASADDSVEPIVLAERRHDAAERAAEIEAIAERFDLVAASDDEEDDAENGRLVAQNLRTEASESGIVADVGPPLRRDQERFPLVPLEEISSSDDEDHR